MVAKLYNEKAAKQRLNGTLRITWYAKFLEMKMDVKFCLIVIAEYLRWLTNLIQIDIQKDTFVHEHAIDFAKVWRYGEYIIVDALEIHWRIAK